MKTLMTFALAFSFTQMAFANDEWCEQQLMVELDLQAARTPQKATMTDIKNF
jgi:hypothetical protein